MKHILEEKQTCPVFFFFFLMYWREKAATDGSLSKMIIDQDNKPCLTTITGWHVNTGLQTTRPGRPWWCSFALWCYHESAWCYVASHSLQRSRGVNATQPAATGLALNGLHPNRDLVSLPKYVYGSLQNPGKQAEILQAHKDVSMEEREICRQMCIQVF